ncbi:MAG: hypothetical protein HDS07_09075 [Bacteroides sp.]|nr:hypothetical protein [Bacteroides sp.]
MKILRWAFMAAAIALTATACNDDDDNTIVDDYTLNISGPSEGNFFVDGKSWVAQTGESGRYVKYTVVGDTMVARVKAKKIQSELTESGEKSPDYRVVYEQNGVVYLWKDGAFRPLMDFNVGLIGRIYYRYLDGSISTKSCLVCTKKSEIQVGDRKLEVLYMQEGPYTTGSPEIDNPTCYLWIESIGVFPARRTGRYITRLSDSDITFTDDKFWKYQSISWVYQDDELIFNYHDFQMGGYNPQ